MTFKQELISVMAEVNVVLFTKDANDIVTAGTADNVLEADYNAYDKLVSGELAAPLFVPTAAQLAAADA